jgi:hypothetical protein
MDIEKLHGLLEEIKSLAWEKDDSYLMIHALSKEALLELESWDDIYQLIAKQALLIESLRRQVINMGGEL